MKKGPGRPVCGSCPHDIHYPNAIPMRQFGVMMHMGEHYCTGGKRARRFKKSDPKVYVPDWCPKRKSPCELRVYGFRNEDEQLMYSFLCMSLRRPVSPSESRYALKCSLHTELTPQEFWRRYALEPVEDLLPVKAELYQVMEIDDGLKPAFFYRTENGFEYLLSFDTDKIRKNVKGD